MRQQRGTRAGDKHANQHRTSNSGYAQHKHRRAGHNAGNGGTDFIESRGVLNSQLLLR